MSFARRFTAILANLSLLLNSFLPFILAATPVYAQIPEDVAPIIEEIVTPTPEPQIQVVEEPSVPTPEVTPEPTPTIAEPINIEVGSLTPTVEVTPTALPTPTPEPQIQEEAPASQIETVFVENNTCRTDVLNPSLFTDKSDYAPTDLAIITGSNLEPNTQYLLVITSNGLEHNYTITTDFEGKFTYSYQLDGIYRPDYQVEIKDLEGNLITSTAFTDSLPAFPYSCTGQCVSKDVKVQIIALVDDSGNPLICGINDTLKDSYLKINYTATAANRYSVYIQGSLLINDIETGLINAYNTCADKVSGSQEIIYHIGDVACGSSLSIRNLILNWSNNTLPDETQNCENVFNITHECSSPKCFKSESDYVITTPPSLKLIKEFSGDEGIASDWTLTASGPSTLSGNPPLNNPSINYISGVVLAGTYNLSESGPLEDYTASDWSCVVNNNVAVVGNSINLVNNDKAVCTITNTKKITKGTLIVKKEIVNDNGGAKTYSDFSFKINDDSSTPFNSNGENEFELDPGSYNITEVLVNGYSPTYNNCSINLVAGETQTCTITNNDIQPKLTVTKVVETGSAQVSDFTLKVGDVEVSSGQQNGFNVGTYTVSEVPVDGYTGVIGGDCASDGSITLSPGDVKSCIIINTRDLGSLIIQKMIDDGSDLTKWGFSLNGGEIKYADTYGVVNFGQLPTGNYYITESGPNGYRLSSIAGDCNANPTVATQADTTITKGNENTCIFTNDVNKGTLTIIKDSLPNDPQDFAFTTTGNGLSNFSLDDDDDATLSNTKVFSNLFPGTYSIVEGNVAGWNQTSATCDNGDSPDSITIDPGENIICTFTNTKNATLTVKKEVVNNDGGTKTIADFGITFSGGDLIFNSGVVAGDSITYTSTPIQIGDFSNPYTLYELDVLGYLGTDWDCGDTERTEGEIRTSISFVPGENKICTIINDDIAPKLKLVKQVIVDDNGTAKPGDWSLTATGTVLGFTDSGDSETFHSVKAGTEYTLSESYIAGYTSGNWFCNGGSLLNNKITLALNEKVTCVIVNNDIAPKLTLIKEVINNNGGSATVNDFTLKANNTVFTSSISQDVLVGTYNLSETGPSGYAPSSWACVGGIQNESTITLTEGQSATCTIKNDDIAPKLTIVKNVINDDGGDKVVSDFKLYIDGISAISGTPYDVLANKQITVSEDTLPGYTPSDWGGDCTANGTITLLPGDSKTCTITNDDQKASITLIKEVIKDNGGTASENDFGLSIGDISVQSSQKLILKSNQSYIIDEVGLIGYSYVSLTGDDKCPEYLGGTVDLKPGDDITCTITNDDKPGTLIVKKIVINDNSGTLETKDFSFSINEDDAVNFNSNGENEFTVDSGIYSIAEIAVPGYSISYNNCSEVFVPNGGISVCTITNDDIFGQIEVIKFNDINGNGEYDEGENTLSDWEINLSDLTKTTNQDGQTFFDQLIPGQYVLGENQQSGWQQTGIYCKYENDEITPTVTPTPPYEAGLNNTINLTAGQNLQCYIGNQYVEPKITISKSNNKWPTAVNNGSEVEYTITLKIDDNALSDVVVTDLPPYDFKYKAGSYKVLINGNPVSIPEPVYSSPGKWLLGDLNKDDIVTLVYTAIVGNSVDPGTHKDAAWAYGFSGSDKVLATSVAPGVLTNTFVGTQIKLDPVFASQEVNLVNEEGQVLGATIEMPATGSETIWLIIFGLLSALGLGFIIYGFKKEKNNMKSLIVTSLIALSFLFIAKPIMAVQSENIYIAIEDPSSPTNKNQFDLSFTTLDILNRPLTVKCFKVNPDNTEIQTETIEVKAGGNSGLCSLKNHRLTENEKTYYFYAIASADEESYRSDSVAIDYNTSRPGVPREYSKEKEGTCNYKISFKASNDGKTDIIRIYRSELTKFVADSGSQIGQVGISPDQKGSFTDVNVPDCSKTYYYVIRAFDKAGNGSGLAGDFVTVYITSTEESDSNLLGAIPIIGDNIPQESVDSQDEEIDSDLDSGSILGETQDPKSFTTQLQSILNRYKLASALTIILLLIIIGYGIKKIRNKNKKKR